MFPSYDFFVIQTETRFCYIEDGWKVRMNICTALCSFVNVCCLSQSEVSTDNRKGSTFFCIPTCSLPLLLSFNLDRFLITLFENALIHMERLIDNPDSFADNLMTSIFRLKFNNLTPFEKTGFVTSWSKECHVMLGMKFPKIF